jgi:hypothetical protein
MNTDPLDRGFGVTPVPIPASDSFRPLTKKVLLILPSYKTVCPMTSVCVAQLSDRRRVALMQNFDDAFVAHTRNNCAKEFLRTEYEYALWMDDDMIVPCGHPKWFKSYCGWPNFPDRFAGFNAIDRLLSHQKTVVGGLYFGRRPGGPPVYAEGMSIKSEADYARTGPFDLIKPTNWIGFGCTMTHRSAFEDIVKKFPALDGHWFTSSEHSIMDDVSKTMSMLSEGPMTGEKAFQAYGMLEGAVARASKISCLGVGEDVIFCRRAREAGHQIYVDFGLMCGHVGHKVYPEGIWQ